MAISRKVVKTGGSLTVTIPTRVLKYLNIKRGDTVFWMMTKDGSVILRKQTFYSYPGSFIGHRDFRSR